MSRLEAILERLDYLENEVRRLSAKNSEADAANDFERLPPTATVGKEYVAYRFRCSIEAVRRGRAETSRLRSKLITAKPMRWIKRDVDEAWREFSKSATEKALDAIAVAPRTKRRKSIITKKLN